MSESSFSNVPERVPFAQIANSMLRDPRLSLKAKGLLALMLTFRHDWKYYMDQLQTLSTDGREAHQNAMKELLGLGYVERFPDNDPVTGKLRGWAHIITDQPDPDFTVERESRLTVKPSDGKPAAKNTNPKKTNPKKTKNNLSAPADGQGEAGSQEGQEGTGNPLPPSQPKKTARKAAQASTGASTGESSGAAALAAALAGLWNEHRGNLSAVRLPVGPDRLKLLKRVVATCEAQGSTPEETKARWVKAVTHVASAGFYKKEGYGLDNLARNFEANETAAQRPPAGHGQRNVNATARYADDQ